MAKQPWRHQWEAYDFVGSVWSSGHNGAALISSMGTGKSLVGVALIRAFQFKRVILVSGAKSMVGEWVNYINGDSNGLLNGVELKGTTLQKAAQLKKLHRSNKAFVAVINVESFWRKPLADVILEIPWDLAIVDESQKIKSAGSQASKFAHRLARKFPAMKKLVMTGTPIHNSPVDAYGQYRFVNSRIFGTNFAAFKLEYTIQRAIKSGVMIVVGYQNLDKLAQKMHAVSFRVEDDVLDLPELMPPIERHIDLLPKNMKLYKELEDKFILDFELARMQEHNAEGVLITPNMLSRIMRLQQLTSGFLPTVDDFGNTEIQVLGMERQNALQDLIEEIDPQYPVVVFARFKYDLLRIADVAKKLGREYLEQSGKTHQWQEWRDREDNSILGVQTQAGGSGISLVRSPYAIYYSHVQSLGDYEQSVKRLHRPGQLNTTFVYHLICNDTIDEKISRALVEKRDIARYIVDDYRKAPISDS